MFKRNFGFGLIKERQRFSLLELLIVVAIATILVGIAVPNFVGLMQTYRRDGAVHQITGDVRKARAEAIRAGWQYRIFGYNAGADSPYKNQYRRMARSSTAVGWPADTVASFQSATQIAEGWVDIDALYSGISLNPSDATDEFSVAFDSRGVRIELDASFDPLVIVNEAGSTKSITVATVGTVRVE